MVAIRGAHLNDNKEFVLERWVEGLAQDAAISKALIDAYHHCQTLGDEQTLAQPLWSGREMIEILVTLSMDKDTLLAALLFPVAEDGLLSAEDLKEHYGNTIAKLVDGVQEMALFAILTPTTKKLPRHRWTMSAVCCFPWWMIFAAW